MPKITLPLTTTDRGNNYLLIAVDICTRFYFLRLMTDNTSATTVIHLIDDFTTFGFPRIPQSDNGTEFINGFMKLLKASTAVSSRCLSLVEALMFHSQTAPFVMAVNKTREDLTSYKTLMASPSLHALFMKASQQSFSTESTGLFNYKETCLEATSNHRSSLFTLGSEDLTFHRMHSLWMILTNTHFRIHELGVEECSL
ncbi:KRAB-A domain-containing protein 2-like protein [Planoprotostelium fungivorum]|uniref:KRAB-A domain-containing protein 2-like protein n=1 Tax=Planoprotostelium fungivorum TaxID=1890364 RepID=A0A2P6NFS4_9EUKA|nr:KRAB-A domain-containing protein 2-like protein [Planoprotostelium fungivorum]